MSHNTIDAYRTELHATSCMICHRRKALGCEESTLQLCQRCTDDVFPGSDVKRYNELQALFGYGR